MDPKLAEIYGTNQVDEVDTEKLAAAALAEGLAETNEIDLSSLSDEDIETLAASVLASSSEEVSEEEVAEEGADEETQVKVAEADYLGRVMAHSFWQEKTDIEKEAGTPEFSGAISAGQKSSAERKAAKGRKLKHVAKKGAHKAEMFGRKGTDAVGKAGKYVGGKARDASKFVAKHVASGAKATGGHMMRNRGKYGLGGAALAAGGAAYGMAKKSSALDTLAEQRAIEILAANGIELSEETEQEKVSSGNQYDVLANAVEARAAEMLEAAGYEFEAEETEE